MSDETAKATDLNWADLAKSLGFSRVSLTKWRKLPNAPVAPELVAWQIFIEENDLGTGRKASKEREEELTKRVKLQNRILSVKVAKDERRVIDRDDVEAMLLTVATRSKTLLYQKLERELPAKAAGLTSAEISLVGRDVADEIAGIMASGFGDWGQGL